MRPNFFEDLSEWMEVRELSKITMGDCAELKTSQVGI